MCSAVNFPESARLEVPAALAGDLLGAVESLPHYDNKDFYSTVLQQLVRDRIHENFPDGFQWLVTQISERKAQSPDCVLVTGLRFVVGNRLVVGLNWAFG